MCKLFFCISFLFVLVHGMDEENTNRLRSNLIILDKEISDLIDSVVKDTNVKIEQKVVQASRNGRSSENCAKEAGARFLKDVQKALENGLRKEQKSLRAIRQTIEDRTISQKALQDLQNDAVNMKVELVMTNTLAEIETFGLKYAKLANDCS